MGTSTRAFTVNELTRDVDAQLAYEWVRELGCDAVMGIGVKNARKMKFSERCETIAAAIAAPKSKVTKLKFKGLHKAVEHWLVKALAHKVAPTTAPHPETSVADLAVRVTYADDTMPEAWNGISSNDAGRGAYGLALRLVGLAGGPIRAELPTLLDTLPPYYELPFLFRVLLLDRKDKTGRLLILAETRLLEHLPIGIEVDSTAW